MRPPRPSNANPSTGTVPEIVAPCGTTVRTPFGYRTSSTAPSGGAVSGNGPSRRAMSYVSRWSVRIWPSMRNVVKSTMLPGEKLYGVRNEKTDTRSVGLISARDAVAGGPPWGA